LYKCKNNNNSNNNNNNNNDWYVAIKRNAQPTDKNNKCQQRELTKINTN